ncbi:MAG: hypothetical protein HYZ50_13250 [Deltaproteobacteria bacterium]|nr:hypothetical protein [Deltaproteobacteria bacterium]
MRNFVLFAAVFLQVALWAGCLRSPQKDEAARLVAEAVALVEQGQTESGTNYDAAVDLYRNALAKAGDVMTRFPSSFWAEQLRTGEKKIGGYTLAELRQLVEARAQEEMQAGEDPLSYALLLAKNVADTTARGELLGAIAKQYLSLGYQTRAAQIIASSGEASEGVLTLTMKAALATENDAQALSFAKAAPDVESRDWALAWLCGEQVRRGRLAQARLTLEDIADPVMKTEALTTLALAFMAAGEVALSVDWLGWQLVEHWIVPKSLRRNVPLLDDRAAAEELLVQALQISASVEDLETRETLVAEIARGYGVAGQFAEAGQLLLSLTSRKLQAQGLVQLALQQATTGRTGEALVSLSAAQKEQQAVTDPAGEMELLAQFALVSIAAGQDEAALQILSGVKEEKARSGVFAALARKRAAEGKLEEAVQLAQRIGDARLRAKTIAAIARAYPKAGQTERVQVLLARAKQDPVTVARSYAVEAQCEQALQVAEGIDDFRPRLDALFAIARTCTEKGQAEQGEAILTRALAAIRSIYDVADRNGLLKTYAREAMTAGQFAQALRVAEALATAQERAEVFADVAQAWLQAGATERGQACLVRALQEARSIPELRVRTRALVRLARNVIGGGRLALARHIADLIEEVGPRSDLLSVIALSYEEDGDFEHAVQLTADIFDGFVKAKTLADLARRAMKDDQLPRVLQLIGAIQHPRLKDQVLADLARWFSTTGRSADAVAVVAALGESSLKTRLVIELVRSAVTAQQEDEALRLVTTLEDDLFRSHALAAMAREYKRLGQPEYALQAAQRIPDGEERARVVKAIHHSLASAGESEHPITVVRAQIEKGRYEEAEQAVEKLERGAMQADAFAELACRHLKEGRGTKGSELLARAMHLAEGIEFSVQRVRALKNIVRKALASEQLSPALQAASSIARTEDRREVFIDAVRELTIEGQYEQATRLVETLEDAARKAQLLGEIARKYVAAKNSESALAVAQRIDDLPKKAGLLLKIVSVYTDRDEKEKATVVLADTTRVFLSLAEEDQRPLAKSLVLSLARLGQREQAVQLAKGLRTATVRAEVLADLVRAEVEAERYEQALQTVALIDDSAVRATVSAEIARRQVAKGHYAQAFQVAVAIDDAKVRAELLLVIAQQEAELQRPRLEEQENRSSSVSANEALSLPGDEQDRELLRIVRLYAGTKQLQQALTIAETAKNLPLQSVLLAEVGAEYALLGEQEKAAELFARALALVGRMATPDDRIKTLTRIGPLYEKAGRPGEGAVKKTLRDLTKIGAGASPT